MTMISIPEKIFFGIPSGDRRMDIDCLRACYMMLHNYGGNIYMHASSDVALARNQIARRFMNSDCTWFMMIDSDIIFTEQDWDFLWEGAEDIVIGPYARKIPGKQPTDFGLGFTRVHRRVFEAIESLQRDDGSELAGRFYLDGEMHVSYFQNGPSGDSMWLGEDKWFLTLCAMTGIPYRTERRCQLQHVGYFMYGYPNQDSGAKFWTPATISLEDSPDQDIPPDGRPVVIM
jgi:hypothetical protein